MLPLDWAILYHEAGYNPIPEIDKKPLIKWHRFQTERVERGEIEKWWEKWPSAGIGILTGQDLGLVVIDADDQAAVAHVELHLPETPFRVKTSRGMHFYYRHPGKHPVQTRQLNREGSPLHLDIKGEGGKVTGLGSSHASGHIYSLDDGADLYSVLDIPVYDPVWFPKPKRIAPLVARAAPPGRMMAQDNFTRAGAYLSHIQGAGQGSRDCHTHQIAASVVRDFGLTYDQGLALMVPWNEAQNDPPLPLDDIKRIVKSVLERGKYPIGAKLAS